MVGRHALRLDTNPVLFRGTRRKDDAEALRPGVFLCFLYVFAYKLARLTALVAVLSYKNKTIKHSDE
jgi:hypothetical protein